MKDWYENRRGSSNGLEVAYVAVNLERDAFYQSQTDAFLAGHRIGICGNDYTATTAGQIKRLFQPNANQPVFALINGVSNSPSHRQWQCLASEEGYGGTQADFAARVVRWRGLIDAVQAPPPRISDLRRDGGGIRFTVPGQRGRTNRVEATSDWMNWSPVTNLFGTNAPVVIRDPVGLLQPHRFFRVLRF